MKKILILGQMKDLQTGTYLFNSIEELGYKAGFIDIRAIVTDKGIVPGQQAILDEIDKLNFDADIVIVLKGLEMSIDTLTAVRKKFKDKILCNWFFDVKLAGTDIWKNGKFYPAIKLYDYFFCSLKGVADKLKENGFKNVYHLAEACYPKLNGEQHMNFFQEKKYGEDISFIGTIGLSFAHKNRIEYLSRIIREGFNINIWGNIAGEAKTIPMEIRHSMTNTPVINDSHSLVCQTSLVNLGIDQDPTLEYSWSARLYRIMCAGGLYLSTPTKGLEDFFNINLFPDEITKDQDLVVFYDENDLVKKLDFLLEHDDIRDSIRKNGQKKVLAGHTFVHRIKELINIVNKELIKTTEVVKNDRRR